MVDPYFSRPHPPEDYVHSAAPIQADELVPDAVLCTHDHSDHTDPPFLTALAAFSPGTRFVGPPESAERMLAAGISADRVQVVTAGQTMKVGPATVEALLSKTPEVSDVRHLGYAVEVGGVRVYDTGDIMRGVTREPALMVPLRELTPHVALITTSPTEDEFPDFAESAILAAEISANVAVPAHYHCFARRTWDPVGFADAFARSQTKAIIIPYCGFLQYACSGEMQDMGIGCAC
jgi:L-ascorbate metabolism protein UlaG (beta-lactamase superfamily)